MKVELGKTYQTQNGLNCRIICVDRKVTTQYKIIGLIESKDQTQEGVFHFDEEGRHAGFSEYDLKPILQKKYGYVVLNKDNQILGTCWFYTEKERNSIMLDRSNNDGQKRMTIEMEIAE